MKQIFFLLILSIPLFSQYTLPPFGAKPAGVWKFFNIDTSKIIKMNNNSILTVADVISINGDTVVVDESSAAKSQVSYPPVNPDIAVYSVPSGINSDSLEMSTFTFYRDSLVKASYYFTHRGDLAQAVEFFEKKNLGYEWGHGSRQRFIFIEELGRIWYDFTLPQVAQFIAVGHRYESDYYMKNDYNVRTFLQHTREFNLTTYSVTFISAAAIQSGILD